MAELMSSRQETLLIQFAKEPVPGKVKTRMLSQLSALQACTLHTELLLWTCETLCGAQLADVELWVAGDLSHPVFTRCTALGVVALSHQRGADLGERMYHAIANGLQRYRKVILVGSDCPAIDAPYLKAAVAALEQQPLVLGPAADGGYVLIGATQIEAGLFQGVYWGRGSVFRQSVERAARLGMNWLELEVLPDIDRPEDLPLWEALRPSVNRFTG